MLRRDRCDQVDAVEGGHRKHGPEPLGSGREDQQHLLVGQMRDVHPAAVRHIEVQGDVGATRSQHGDDIRIGGADDCDRDVGVARVEAPSSGGRASAARCGWATTTSRPVRTSLTLWTAACASSKARSVWRAGPTSAWPALVNRAPRLTRWNSLHPEFTLEVLDGQAQRRLRDVDRGGGVGERARVGNGEEVLEAAAVDRATLYLVSRTGL